MKKERGRRNLNGVDPTRKAYGLEQILLQWNGLGVCDSLHLDFLMNVVDTPLYE